MRTAVIQMNAGGDKERNLSNALHWIQKAAGKGARFIALPEGFNFRGKIDPRRGYGVVAEKVPGPSIRIVMEAARRHKVHILAGSVCEAIPGRKKVYNTSVLIGPDGKIKAKYRKRNLFLARLGVKKLDESRHFAKGRKQVLATVNGWPVGLSICYDLRFPEIYREYARSGAQILCVPSIFTRETGKAHWEVLLRARAVENLCYVLAPNQIGKDGKGVPSYGNSMIIGPWGNVLARGPADREAVVIADLERNAVQRAKKILPPPGKK